MIHTAFIHDFSNYAAAAETDRRAIETLGAAVAGSDRPLVVTGGTLLLQRQGPLATEEDAPNPRFPRKSDEAALAVAARGVRVSVLRLPPSVHAERVVVHVRADSERTSVEITWRGGLTMHHEIARAVTRHESLSEYPELLKKIRQLRKDGCTIAQVALRLNEEGNKAP